jgi:outer membrane protein assembly factor BamB
MNTVKRSTRKWVVVATATVTLIAVVSVCGPRAAAQATPRPPRTLKPVWTHVMHNGPWGLAVDARGAIVTTDLWQVQSLRPDGHVRWKAPVESIVFGTPAADSSVVLVGGRRRVTALARRDGRQRWEQPMGADVTSVALARGLALVGDQAGNLAAFDAGSGILKWSVHYEGRLWSAPRVEPRVGAVVATWHWSSTPAVRVFDLETGKLRWDAPTAGYTAAPVVSAGVVVVAMGAAEHHGRVEARELGTGAVRWSTPVPGPFEEAIEPAADGRAVVVVDHDGVATLLDLATGSVRWQHAVEYFTNETQMSLTRERVVFTSFSGDLFVLDRANGRVVSHASARRLGGFPIAVRVTSWAGRAGILVALRMDEPYRVVLLPLG